MPTPSDRDERLEVALRLKAARTLHGRLNAKGQAVALPLTELLTMGDLAVNRVTRNRLESFEQMHPDAMPARPMELELIEKALDLPGWFSTDLSRLTDPRQTVRDRIAAIGARHAAPPEGSPADLQHQPGTTQAQ